MQTQHTFELKKEQLKRIVDKDTSRVVFLPKKLFGARRLVLQFITHYIGRNRKHSISCGLQQLWPNKTFVFEITLLLFSLFVAFQDFV